MTHSKLYQIVRLREILRRWRKKKSLSKAHSFSDVRSATSARREVHTKRSLSMPTSSEGAKLARVPAGHLAVYVGEERKRFVIKMSYLSHPLFRALLKKTEEEMGFHQEGALAIPCQVPFFEHLLQLIHSSKSQSHHSHHHNIMTLLHLSSPHHHHHHQHFEDYLLPPQFQELVQELLLLASPDYTHDHSYHDTSPSLCNLAHSLSSLHVSSAHGVSQAQLV